MARIKLKRKSYPADFVTTGRHIKPCPCGGEVRMYITHKKYKKVLGFHNPCCIRCSKCGSSTDIFSCVDDAVDQWNIEHRCC